MNLARRKNLKAFGYFHTSLLLFSMSVWAAIALYQHLCHYDTCHYALEFNGGHDEASCPHLNPLFHGGHGVGSLAMLAVVQSDYFLFIVHTKANRFFYQDCQDNGDGGRIDDSDQHGKELNT